MTPQEKELKAQAYAAWLENPEVKLEWDNGHNPWRWSPNPPESYWTKDILIRVAPPAEIPESKEARARRLFTDLKSPEGYGDPEFLGEGPIEIEDSYLYSHYDPTLIMPENRIWHKWDNNYSGVKHSGIFYARARKLPTEKEKAIQELPKLLVPLGWSEGTRWEFVNEEWNGELSSEHAYFWPSIGEWFWAKANNTLTTRSFYAKLISPQTDQEKAEAALNAYKLEPGERLVHRGKHWLSAGKCNYLIFQHGRVTRHDSFATSGNNVYYAEIIKEPELVPFTQETFPLGAWVKKSSGGMIRVICAISETHVHPYNGPHIGYEKFLNDGWLISTDSGTTWTRAGKGVGA